MAKNNTSNDRDKETRTGTRRTPTGPRSLAAVLPKIAEPALRKRGFSAAEIVTRWSEIAGEELATESCPDHLSFPKGSRQGGTLHLSATGSVALLIQHQEPAILQRINTYFGYSAVNRLAITQTSSHSRKPDNQKKLDTELTTQQISDIEEKTNSIAEPELRNALNKLGKAVELDKAAEKSGKS
ncbi:MAG: hypothetical protein CMM52_13595 [Rhodospirillaceae bacterium]|nr:hypothetical protein [Rhodospirillaceae bacterium]|tara:strand:- start:11903 stop:12454 length:552 start_codon:yes stop_codon:yes gene_type:complete